MLIGGYEGDPRSRWTDGVPWEHGASPVRVRHGPLRAVAGGRDPPLPVPGARGRDPPALPSRRDDPRRQPAARPDARAFRACGSAAGLSLNGFGGAGGLGRALAEWMTDGEPQPRRRRLSRLALRRGLPRPLVCHRRARARPTATTTGCATRSTPTSGARAPRPSPLHVRLQELGAVFGDQERLGARRPLRARAPVAAQRRRPARASAGPGRPGLIVSEPSTTPFRERVGIIDMTSFGKLEVAGPGALTPARARLRQPHRPRPPAA